MSHRVEQGHPAPARRHAAAKIATLDPPIPRADGEGNSIDGPSDPRPRRQGAGSTPRGAVRHRRPRVRGQSEATDIVSVGSVIGKMASTNVAMGGP
jgi:hypothetical protein